MGPDVVLIASNPGLGPEHGELMTAERHHLQLMLTGDAFGRRPRKAGLQRIDATVVCRNPQASAYVSTDAECCTVHGDKCRVT
jgi:hypothetical protein